MIEEEGAAPNEETAPHQHEDPNLSQGTGPQSDSTSGDGAGEGGDNALADLCHYLDVCLGGDSTSGWLHVSVGYNPHFNAKGIYSHTKPNGRPGLVPKPFRWPEEARDAMKFILAESAKADVFVCPNLMRRDWIWTAKSDTDCRKKKTGRRKRDAVARFTVHADADGQVDIDKVKSIEGAFAVASGTPGHAHVYARLSESVSCAWHDALGRGLGAYVVGADADCKFSDNDLLRPPGTLNHKSAARGGEPTPVTWLVRP